MNHFTKVALVSGLLIFSLSACDSGSSGKSSDAVQVGKAMYAFDPARVTDLMISKNDASNGEHWTVQLQKNESSQEENLQWQILSAPGGKELSDRFADSGFIRHLLDTLTTLSPAEMAPKGPLASFGLTRPHYALQWRSEGKLHELRIGLPAPKGGYYAQAHIPSQSDLPVVAVRGAALEMLRRIETFEAIRRRTLVTFKADDVDEFELRKGSKLMFYAQRQGVDWVDRKHRPLGEKTAAQLEAMVHLRVQAFMDEPEPERAPAFPEKNPLYQVTFRDRKGMPTDLRVAQVKNRVLAQLSSRPGAVFELFPESLKIFEGKITH